MEELVIVESIEEMYSEINRIKNEADDYQSNFFIDRPRLYRWMHNKHLQQLKYESAYLLVYTGSMIDTVFYFGANKSELATALMELTSIKRPLIVDYMAKEDTLCGIFEAAGFYHHTTLHRMIRMTDAGEETELAYGEYADLTDLYEIRELLLKTMDKKGDRIPEPCDIEDYIRRKQAILVRDVANAKIAACILWTRKGVNMEFNYWALSPDYKGSMYGMDLLNAFYKLNNGVRRTTLFVREGNISGIIHARTGYKEDGLCDYVYCLE